MRYGVVTEELASVAAAVRADSTRLGAQAAPLGSTAEQGGTWTVGRARTAVQALFDTLTRAAEEAEAGLARLGDQVAAAGGEYDTAEGHLVRPR